MHHDRRDGPGGEHRDHGGDRSGPREERRGPEDSSFLDLEISKVLYGEASALARQAVRDILKESIKARLQERLGGRLEAIARIAADELADDIEANLGIEARIAARRDERKAIEQRVREVLQGRGEKGEGG
jgi:hypothetical protein